MLCQLNQEGGSGLMNEVHCHSGGSSLFEVGLWLSSGFSQAIRCSKPQSDSAGMNADAEISTPV